MTEDEILSYEENRCRSRTLIGEVCHGSCARCRWSRLFSSWKTVGARSRVPSTRSANRGESVTARTLAYDAWNFTTARARCSADPESGAHPWFLRLIRRKICGSHFCRRDCQAWRSFQKGRTFAIVQIWFQATPRWRICKKKKKNKMLRDFLLFDN